MSLTTPFETQEPCPWDTYPRPQLRRDSYFCLNGTWQLQVWRRKRCAYAGPVQVPFPPESRLSGVSEPVLPGDGLCYTRSFTLPAGFVKDRVLLHVGACDQQAVVNLNGRELARHQGGYESFTVDLTPALEEGENILQILARDTLNPRLPYGKQRQKRGGMWYTPISGLWQTVWLESVPQAYLHSLRLTPDLEGVRIQVQGGTGRRVLHFEGKEIPFEGEEYYLKVEDPRLWSPEDPHLYPFALEDGEDRVESYFALRTVSVGRVGATPLLLLNGKPRYFHGVLDQGYFPDGLYLPGSPQGFENDVLKMKAFGFDTLRKHAKKEPELFYYYCDKHGMLVFQDMVNAGRYSFVRDTALPTLGFKRALWKKKNPAHRAGYLAHARATQESLYNHPSVVYYTLFNEGWGQFDADGVFSELSQRDPTRVYDTASGWFGPCDSQVESTHVYFKPVELKKNPRRPLVLSEFGGYSLKVPGHVWQENKEYGYRRFTRSEDLADALEQLYLSQILPQLDKGLCATVITQLSDIEDEINGFLTYDRRVEKVPPERMKALAHTLREHFNALYADIGER